MGCRVSGGRGDDQTRQAVPLAQQVQGQDRRDVIDPWEAGQGLAVTPGVAALIAVDIDPVAAQVDQVGRARAVDVGQPEALGVEQVGGVEPGSLVHGDLGPEPAIAQVGPVADLAIADPDHVGEAVAGEVGQEDRVSAVGEYEVGTLLLVEQLAHLLGRSEPLLGQGFVPGEDLVLGDQHVGMAVAGEVDELEVRVVPGQAGERLEGGELIPALVLGPLEEAGRGPAEFDQVEVTVAAQVQELLPAAAERSGRGNRGHPFHRPEFPFAPVWLVEPGVGLLAQDTGYAFAIEVDPLVA